MDEKELKKICHKTHKQIEKTLYKLFGYTSIAEGHKAYLQLKIKLSGDIEKEPLWDECANKEDFAKYKTLKYLVHTGVDTICFKNITLGE